MAKLVYKNIRPPGSSWFYLFYLFIFVLFVMGIFFSVVFMISNVGFRKSLFFLFTNLILGSFLGCIWFVNRPCKHLKNVDIYEEYIEIEGRRYSWQDVIEIKQLSILFFEIKFRNDRNIDLATLSNDFAPKELFTPFRETEWVKIIKELHSKKMRINQ